MSFTMFDNEYDQIFLLADRYYRNTERTHLWMRTENKLLGGLSPQDMIFDCKYNELRKIVEDTLKEISNGNNARNNETTTLTVGD